MCLYTVVARDISCNATCRVAMSLPLPMETDTRQFVYVEQCLMDVDTPPKCKLYLYWETCATCVAFVVVKCGISPQLPLPQRHHITTTTATAPHYHYCHSATTILPHRHHHTSTAATLPLLLITFLLVYCSPVTRLTVPAHYCTHTLMHRY